MKINIGAFISYLFIIGVAVLFMLFLDGPGGSYLLTALIMALLISFGIFLWTRKTLTVEIKVSEDILNKNDTLKSVIVIKKRGFLPTAFIGFSFAVSVHFENNEKVNYSIIIFGQESYSIEKGFRAVFFGDGSIGAGDIVITDYLGLFSCTVLKSEGLTKNVKVYPDIPEINGRDDFARSLTDAVSFDDSEETSQSMVSINGVPGYDHRKYVPGDNLKLINWKLSAKRGELLVRQLEGTGGAEQLFVLIRDDLYFEESQLAAEAMLGMAMVFAKAELPVKVMVYIEKNGSDNPWQVFSVGNVSELFELRYKMTDYRIFPLKRYCAEHKLSNAPELRKIAVPYTVDGDRAVIFAPAYDENLSGFMERLAAEGKECQAAVCTGEIADNKTRRIVREGLSVRFSD